MSASFDAQPLPVTSLGFGTVLVGTEGAAPAGNVGIALEGAMLFVDPCLPGQVPACLVSDPAQAEPQLSGLYGNEVAQLATSVAERPQGDTAEAPFAPGDDETLRRLARLGTVRWLEAHSPLPLDRRLLRLEELTLVGLCGPHLADEANPLDELAGLCRYFVPRLAEEQDFAPLNAMLEIALEHVANHAPAKSSHGPWARDALTALPAAEGPRAGAAAAGPWSVLLRPQFALAAGTTNHSATATGTIGWESLPPGWVSTAEDNARWAMNAAADGVHAWVEIDPAEPVRWFGGASWGHEPGSEELGFHLTCTTTPWLSVSGSLTYDPAAGWAGSVVVDGVLGDSLRQAMADGQRVRLGLRRPSVRPRPASGVDLPRRWSARGVSALRLIAGTDDASLVPCVRDAMLEAAAGWESMGETQAAESCRATIRAAETGKATPARLTLAEQWLLSAP